MKGGSLSRVPSPRHNLPSSVSFSSPRPLGSPGGISSLLLLLLLLGLLFAFPLCGSHSGFSPREMGLEHGTDPQTLHPSPGRGEVLSWLLWESPRPLPTGLVAGAFLGIRGRRGELGLQHWSCGSAPERLLGGTFRTQDGAGSWAGAAGAVPAPPERGHRASPVPVPAASTVPAPLGALEVTFPGTGIRPTSGMLDTVPQQAPQRALGWARGRPCPSLPRLRHRAGRVPQLKPLPEITHPEVALAGHPRGSRILWHRLSSRSPSGLSVYFVWLGNSCGWSPSGRVSWGRALSSALGDIRLLQSRLSQLPVCKTPTEELRTAQRCLNEDITVPVSQ